MKISVIPSNPSLLNNRIFNRNPTRDSVFAPHKALKDLVVQEGHDIATFDCLSVYEADKVLVFDGFFFPEIILSALKRLGPAGLVGVFWEPPQIVPLYFDSDIHSCFGTILLVENTWPDNRRIFYGPYPFPRYKTQWIPFHKRKMLVSISGGKLARFKGSLYPARVKSIRYFQNAFPDSFDMFGEGWERKGIIQGLLMNRRFTAYRGRCENKQDTMRQYCFSICYENCDNIRGWVTEKMFDSMQAGCVPIYLGAPDIGEYVPKDCFIDRRDYDNERQLEEYLRSINEERFELYLSNIKNYLNSDDFQKRLPDAFAKFMLRMITRRAPAELEMPRVAGIRKLKFLSAKNHLRNAKVNSLGSDIRILFENGNRNDLAKFSVDVLCASIRKLWYRI